MMNSLIVFSNDLHSFEEGSLYYNWERERLLVHRIGHGRVQNFDSLNFRPRLTVVGAVNYVGGHHFLFSVVMTLWFCQGPIERLRVPKYTKLLQKTVGLREGSDKEKSFFLFVLFFGWKRVDCIFSIYLYFSFFKFNLRSRFKHTDQ